MEQIRQVLCFQKANMEYGCAAPLSSVDGRLWNADEKFESFGGLHHLVSGGLDNIATWFVEQLMPNSMRLSAPVTKIECAPNRVDVTFLSGEEPRTHVF